MEKGIALRLTRLHLVKLVGNGMEWSVRFQIFVVTSQSDFILRLYAILMFVTISHHISTTYA